MMYQNLKNKLYYQVIGETVNRTNAQEGEVMVLYLPLYSNDQTIQCRSKNEFNEKFKEVDLRNQTDDDENLTLIRHKTLESYSICNESYFEYKIRRQIILACKYRLSDLKSIIDNTIQAARLRWTEDKTMAYFLVVTLKEVSEGRSGSKGVARYLLELFPKISNMEFSINGYSDYYGRFSLSELLKKKLPKLSYGEIAEWLLFNSDLGFEHRFQNYDWDDNRFNE